MKQFLDTASRRLLVLCTLTILVLVPFHAFLTVWAGSTLGHYTAVRLWEEVLLLFMTVAGVYVVVRQRLWRTASHSSLVWLIAVYLLVQLAGLVVALYAGSVNFKAGLYGLLLNCRFLLFFGLAWLAASQNPLLRRHWRRIILLPAAFVVMFGLLQRFVLPHDFLKHFGYGDATIPPFETIDHKVQYLRIQSTLRGANLLGAYLLIVLATCLTGLRRYYRVAALLAGLVVLFLSGSRAAWLGAAVTLAFLLWLELPSARAKRVLAVIAAACLVVAVGAIIILRNENFVQNTVFHTDEHSRSSISSNAAHLSATKGALKQVAKEPLGRGVGTAGPASVYNTKEPGRIAEDYYLQIGQETGWLGLFLFIGIIVFVTRALWLRRHEQLPRLLLASFMGLGVVALLMHLWADETVAFLWWGLAGIALAPLSEVRPLRGKNTKINRDDSA